MPLSFFISKLHYSIDQFRGVQVCERLQELIISWLPKCPCLQPFAVIKTQSFHLCVPSCMSHIMSSVLTWCFPTECVDFKLLFLKKNLLSLTITFSHSSYHQSFSYFIHFSLHEKSSQTKRNIVISTALSSTTFFYNFFILIWSLLCVWFQNIHTIWFSK